MELRSDGFQIVGADYRQHVPEIKKQTFRQWIKGKPIISIMLLVVIVGGCLFAEQLYNHDPSDFYLQNLNQAPGKEFYFGTDSLGRDIYSMIWYGGRAHIDWPFKYSHYYSHRYYIWLRQRYVQCRHRCRNDARRRAFEQYPVSAAGTPACICNRRTEYR